MTSGDIYMLNRIFSTTADHLFKSPPSFGSPHSWEKGCCTRKKACKLCYDTVSKPISPNRFPSQDNHKRTGMLGSVDTQQPCAVLMQWLEEVVKSQVNSEIENCVLIPSNVALKLGTEISSWLFSHPVSFLFWLQCFPWLLPSLFSSWFFWLQHFLVWSPLSPRFSSFFWLQHFLVWSPLSPPFSSFFGSNIEHWTLDLLDHTFRVFLSPFSLHIFGSNISWFGLV